MLLGKLLSVVLEVSVGRSPSSDPLMLIFVRQFISLKHTRMSHFILNFPFEVPSFPERQNNLVSYEHYFNHMVLGTMEKTFAGFVATAHKNRLTIRVFKYHVDGSKSKHRSTNQGLCQS